MVATNQAIDYEALLACLVEEVAATTGLPETSIYADQPAAAFAQQPPQPLMTIHVASSGRYGYDWGEDSDSLRGPRNIQVSFNCFSEDRMQAADIMETWGAGLFAQSTRAALARIGFAVWSTGQVLDMTEKYDTGFQPRTYMQVTFGTNSFIESDTGSIAQFTVNDQLSQLPQGASDSSVVSTGTTTTVQVAPSDDLGQLVCVTADAQMSAADANTGALMPAVGMIVSKPTPTSAVVQVTGVTPPGLLSGLQPAKVYFVGTQGALMLPPVTSVIYVQKIGVAISSTQLLLHISPTGIVNRTTH